jgi:hypothetical protein
VISLLAPLTGTLLGFGLLRRCAPEWPTAVRLGAGMVIGPPLATLLVFLGVVAGLPYGPWMAWFLLVLGGGVCFFPGPRTRSPAPLPVGAIVISAAGALWLLGVLGLDWLASPTPDSDGMLNFGLKARAFHVFRDPIGFLQDPRLYALHPDYPLHVPYAMCLGWLWSGDMASCHALSADLLVLPGAALFLGTVIGARSVTAAGAVVTLYALLPCVRFGFVIGGADSILAAVTLVAGYGLLSGRASPVAGGIAAGLLTWIKLEGVIILAALAVLALVRPWPRPRDRALMLASVSLGAIWPLTLQVAHLRLPVAEVETVVGDLSYAILIVTSFARNWIDPDRMALVLIPITLACALALIRGSGSQARWAAAAFLLLGVSYPVRVWFRRSRPEDLQVFLTRRLVQVWIPLGLLVLGSELADAVRSWRRAEAEPDEGADRNRATDLPITGGSDR